MLLHRRLFDPRIRKTSSFSDIAILILLCAQLAIGLLTIVISLEHLDGAEMVRFMAWAQGIFTFDTQAAFYIQNAHWIFKLHIFLGLTIFLVFPFTRLVHMLSVPLRYFWRPGYQIVRSKRVPRGMGAE
jgi:nitrate reductase gamma subunit